MASAVPVNDTPTWHTISLDEVATRLKTDFHDGLTNEEAHARLEHDGPNRLPTAPAPTWPTVLIRQFREVLVVLLLVAAGIAFLVGEFADGVTITIIVILNGVLGFVQEWKAERVLDALRGMLAPTAQVVRAGQEATIAASELVPGDVVLLKAGALVPADLRLVESLQLRTDDSALTGESNAVAKSPDSAGGGIAEQTCMTWAGTTVTSGRARAVTVATGRETEIGRISRLTQRVGMEQTPLQRQLAKVGKQLGVVAVIISAAVALAGWAAGRPLLEMFMTGVSLAVAVVPEGLPAVVTITLALGVRSMVRRNALLRRLQAAETLGSATVICTDKTGTITKNEMTVREIWLPAGNVAMTGSGYDPAGHFEVDGQPIDPKNRPDLLALLDAGRRCNHAGVERVGETWRKIGEPTEAALIVAAHKARLPHRKSERGAKPAAEFLFTSDRKRMTIVENDAGKQMAYVKGAPDVLLPRCAFVWDGNHERPMAAADQSVATQAYAAMANSGLRTLALARRELPSAARLDEGSVEQECSLLGIVGMLDPPHDSVPEAIRTAQAAGARILMITGDAPGTAAAIAKRVGLPVSQVVTGPELELLDDEQLARVVSGNTLFARTTPAHKLRIVEALQHQGEVVAMTGDGVNDAPALKKADVGVAMGIRGTEVAKSAADMVLLDDNFTSIVHAVEEGRRQYRNIQKFVRYLLSSNVGEVIAIAANIMLGGPLILLPVQILWMNLVTDGLTAVALGVEPSERNAMRRAPRGLGDPIMGRGGIAMTLSLGLYVGLGTLWLFHHYLAAGADFATAQTVAFTGIIIIEKMNVLNFRSLDAPLRNVGVFSNPWLLVALLGTIGLQCCAVYVPFLQESLHTVALRGADWLRIAAVAVPIFAVTETIKWIRDKRRLRATEASPT